MPGRNARAELAKPAHTQHLTIGRPFWSPGWGRWMIWLGGDNYRTASEAERDRHVQTRQEAESRMPTPTTETRGQEWQRRSA